MESSSRSGLQGLRVISFESRRAKEMTELIRRHGGEPIVAPSMREVPLSENSAPLELFQKIEAGRIDLVVLLTGVGTRTMVDALAIHYSTRTNRGAARQGDPPGSWTEAGGGAERVGVAAGDLRRPNPTLGRKSSRFWIPISN